uniref:Uncharacterized protein n=1 Tax=viral metagenome TaxID=1070528 RepID=A0A6H1ZG57_9ZZZZ
MADQNQPWWTSAKEEAQKKYQPSTYITPYQQAMLEQGVSPEDLGIDIATLPQKSWIVPYTQSPIVPDYNKNVHPSSIFPPGVLPTTAPTTAPTTTDDDLIRQLAEALGIDPALLLGGGGGGGGEGSTPLTKPDDSMLSDPVNNKWMYDSSANAGLGGWVEVEKYSAYEQWLMEKARIDADNAKLKEAGIPQPTDVPQDAYGRVPVWDARDGLWRYPPDWGQVPANIAEKNRLQAEEAARAQAAAQAAEQVAYQNQQLALQSQQQSLQTQQQAWQRQQAETAAAQEQKNYLAQLAAQPISWLQHAAASGQQPAVQPWMLPLMPQQYAGTVAGAPLPGFQQGQEGATPSMAQLPALTNPSLQYWQRMTPAAQQQFLGYRQARTGSRPEDTLWRFQTTAPPSGQNKPLQYVQ